MAYEEITALLGGWPGFRLVGVRREGVSPKRPVPRVVLTLEAVPGEARRCSRCGEVVAEVHDVTPREVRDLPILDAETWLILPRVRLKCPRCGPTVEAVPWLDRYQRMTTRFAESVARLAQVLPIKQVAEHYGLSWDTVKAIDRAALAARLGPVDLSGVRQIAIDEFAMTLAVAERERQQPSSVMPQATNTASRSTPWRRSGSYSPSRNRARSGTSAKERCWNASYSAHSASVTSLTAVRESKQTPCSSVNAASDIARREPAPSADRLLRHLLDLLRLLLPQHLERHDSHATPS